MALSPGARLGPYEVTGPLGAGGMGEVYRALDTRLDRTVAVKVLPEAMAADVDRRARFEREARMVSALNHPNICALFDVGQQDGFAYLVMELLEGETLADRLRRGPLPLDQTLRFGRQIADALDKAHRLGIVHRDLKPGNVMVTRDGVKLLDFGLAKKHRDPQSAAGPALSALDTESRALTTDGALLGTFQYMAPEQLEGRDADARSDIWALGCVLYEMATGTRPFHGKSQASLIGAILRDEPRALTAVDPLAPAALDRLVKRCLAKDPDDRWSSAHDVALALSDIETAPAPRTTTSRTRRVWVPALAILAAMAVGAAGAWGVLGRQKPGSTAADQSGARFHRVTYRPGTVFAARFAPDGQTIVYTAAWGGDPPELFLGRQGTPEARSLGFPGTKLLSISATGEMALFRGPVSMDTELGSIFQAALTGGAPRELVDSAHSVADWTPDGQLAVLQHEDGGRDRFELPIGTKLVDIQNASVADFRLSPDGSQAAFSQFGTGTTSLYLVGRDGAKKGLIEGYDVGGGLAWSPDGREIWFTGLKSDATPRVYAASLDGSVRTVLKQSGWTHLHDVYKDGRALVSTHTWRGGIAFGRAGEPAERPLGWLDYSDMAALSADGSTVLFNESREGGGEHGAVYLRRTDGSPAVRLGDGRAADLSPDGRWVLASRGPAPTEALLIPTGAGAPRTIPLRGLRPLGGAAFAADGARIVLGAREAANSPPRVYVMDVATGNARAVSGDGFRPFARAVTPDGRAVVCTNPANVKVLCPLDGGPAAPLPHLLAGDVPLRFSRDGRLLVTIADTMPRRVEKVDLATGKRTPWRSFAPADRTGLVEIRTIMVTPDESAWAYTYDRTLSDLYVAEGLR